MLCKTVFLQDLIKILQENYFVIISCKIFLSCKKDFIFSIRLARYVQDLVQELISLARKIQHISQATSHLLTPASYFTHEYQLFHLKVPAISPTSTNYLLASMSYFARERKLFYTRAHLIL